MTSTSEKLSSGQRINRASDDAAGLAVADSLRVQSRLYTGALRNINDGISLLSVMDGTVANQSAILTRLAELSEQSANGVFSSTQRKSLDNEYRTLLSEFSRLAESTSFNGLKPLLGMHSIGFSNLSLQAGIDGSINSLLRFSSPDTGRFSGAMGSSLLRYADGTLDLGDFDQLSAAIGATDLDASYSNGYHTQVRDSSGATREVVVVAAEYSDNGTFGSSYSGGNGVMTFHLLARNATTGRWETVSGGNMLNVVGTGTSFNVQFDGTTKRATSPHVELSFAFQNGNSGTLNLDFSSMLFQVGGSESTTIDFTSIQTADSARVALDVTRERLSSLSNIRGEIGALLSRLNTAASVVSIGREGATAAESRIRDVDIATESAKYAANQILQNVATSILAQANAQPRILIDILKQSRL